MRADRLLVALATLRLTAKEVGELKRFIADRSIPEIIRILHQLEDAIDDGNFRINTDFSTSTSQVDLEVENRIRQILQNAKLSSRLFAEMMVKLASSEGKNLPKFDAKKGFSNWISLCLRTSPPSELLRLATVVGSEGEPDDRSWQLR